MQTRPPWRCSLRFGDSWEHLVEVEDELPVECVTMPIPRCLAGERACPPEDCGGPPGYQRLLVEACLSNRCRSGSPLRSGADERVFDGNRSGMLDTWPVSPDKQMPC